MLVGDYLNTLNMEAYHVWLHSLHNGELVMNRALWVSIRDTQRSVCRWCVQLGVTAQADLAAFMGCMIIC